MKCVWVAELIKVAIININMWKKIKAASTEFITHLLCGRIGWKAFHII